MALPDLPEAARLVGEDLAYQRKVWRVQRVGWAVMGLVVVAACAGAFGNGPLARGRAEAGPEGPSAHYERIQRAGRDARMTLTLPRPPEGARLRLTGPLVEELDIVSATPADAVAARTADTLVLRVPALPGGDGAVVLRTWATHPGLFRATLSDGSREVSFRLLVLP